MRSRLRTPDSNVQNNIPHERIEREDEIQRYYKLTGKVLGKGSFGTVLEAENIAENGFVAVKKVDKAKAGTAEVKLLEREVTILKMISHQYIINLLRVFETTTTMYLVQEKCDCELGTHLANQKENKLSENACQNVIRQTAEALYYLHRRGIIHRDLKCENILVVKSATNNIKDIEIRITDFGLAVVSGQDFQESMCGTPLYMAPEILCRHSYSLQCDIWSLGIIAYKIMTGVFPFLTNIGENELTEVIKEGKFDYSKEHFIGYSDRAINLVKNMLKVDPAIRLTAGEIEDSAWVQDREGNDKMNVLDMMREFQAEEDERVLRGEDENGESETSAITEAESITTINI